MGKRKKDSPEEREIIARLESDEELQFLVELARQYNAGANAQCNAFATLLDSIHEIKGRLDTLEGK